VPDGSVEVVIVGGVGAASMMICSGFVSERLFASVTFAVKLDVPAVVGVPVITPALDSVNPAGKVPTLTDHVSGAVPPLAASVVEGYAVPTVPLGSVDVVMVGGVGAGLMMI
jgi:hypothetical protein